MSRSEEFHDARSGGQWDRSGDEPRWVQPHQELVQDALHSWKGWPSSMGIHMSDEQAGAPQPGSGSGKQMRAQAAALLRELHENARPNDRPLYRGSHVDPGPVEGWSESRAVAQGWARKGGGRLYVLPKGTGRGVRVADHVSSSRDMDEREWLVHNPQGYEVRDVPPRKKR